MHNRFLVAHQGSTAKNDCGSNIREHSTQAAGDHMEKIAAQHTISGCRFSDVQALKTNKLVARHCSDQFNTCTSECTCTSRCAETFLSEYRECANAPGFEPLAAFNAACISAEVSPLNSGSQGQVRLQLGCKLNYSPPTPNLVCDTVEV